VALAERAHGPIPEPVAFDYVWGDALAELDRVRPDARIVNLETAVTTSEAFWPEKGIHYRMHPRHVPCLQAAGIDCCVLANNHVLDWGYPGLHETLQALATAGLSLAGAGRDLGEAQAPAVLPTSGGGRVLIFACGCESSGVPPSWAAGPHLAGVDVLPDLSAAEAQRLGSRVAAAKREGDLVVASIHWGDNWGYPVPAAQRAFAHRLIEEAGVDLVHGHSSHHPKAIEVHHRRLVLYGCGDFLNDYEGIAGYEEYRGDLALMYFPTLDPASGRLLGLELTPLRLRRFRLETPPAADVRWLQATLDRECRVLGTAVEPAGRGRLALRW
jgi:poly-gamma-glutamate synthesis protein (capsule biosynthesis protein)